MTILDWFRRDNTPEDVTRAKMEVDAAADIMSVLRDIRVPDKPSIKDLENVAEDSSIVGGAVREITEAVSNVEPNADSPAVRSLLQQPNEYEDFSGFITAFLKSYLTTGVGYALKLPKGGAVVDEMHVIQPSELNIQRGPITKPYAKISYSAHGVKKKLDITDLVIMLAPGTKHPAIPASPIMPVWDVIKTDIAREKSARKLYDRVPYMLPIVQLERDVPPKYVRQLKESLTQIVGSDVLVLPKDLEIQIPRLHLNELFQESPELAESRVCAALNVPPILPGFKVGLDRSTFANYEEARKSFYTETIEPLLGRLSRTLSRSLNTTVELTLPEEPQDEALTDEQE